MSERDLSGNLTDDPVWQEEEVEETWEPCAPTGKRKPMSTVAPKKFRKNPVVIEAMQWEGDNQREVLGWVGADNFYGPIPEDLLIRESARTARLYVAANAAWLDLETGEWIIKDALGYYPCKQEIFDKTYTETETP